MTVSSNRLIGKVALVTGAARGIGAAIAEAFIQEGARVVLTDTNDQQGRDRAESLGPAASYMRLDVRQEEDWSTACTSIMGTQGAIDILVNNAGITGLESGNCPHDPEHVSLADWRAVHQTNLDGVLLGCKYAIRHMRHAGGAIINIASRSGVVGIPAAAAYASSKAAVCNHTRSVALYCAEQGLQIRCNAILPAAILTPMWEPMLGTLADRQSRIEQIVKDTPLRRFGQPEEVACLAVLLASNEVNYMTGAELHVDGGLLAGSVAAPKRA